MAGIYSDVVIVRIELEMVIDDEVRFYVTIIDHGTVRHWSVSKFSSHRDGGEGLPPLRGCSTKRDDQQWYIT